MESRLEQIFYKPCQFVELFLALFCEIINFATDMNRNIVKSLKQAFK